MSAVGEVSVSGSDDGQEHFRGSAVCARTLNASGTKFGCRVMSAVHPGVSITSEAWLCSEEGGGGEINRRGEAGRKV